MELLSVALGGFFGSILRFYIGEKFHKHILATFIINLSGSILLGYLLRLYLAKQLPDEVFFIFGAGFCGAYTTFSTFSYELLHLIKDGKIMLASAYLFSSLFISITIVYLLIS